MRRKAIRSLRRRIHHDKEVRTQLETDQRTYGSIGRERSLAFAGWKETPTIDLIAVLQNQREYDEILKYRHDEVRNPEEEDEDGE
jgi:hypothetical protein